ncbi:MAG TPA: endonuclease/exonuclease/phosphatase family protein [Pyrinomonadaceae bacterium]|nr:endonuclease/exonuclease/phosphatase family protein [Pyrinomonadaceae bacterium]
MNGGTGLVGQRFFSLLLAGTLAGVQLMCPNTGSASLDRPSSIVSDIDDSRWLETGQPSKARSVINAAADLKVISYNIRYRSGADLQKLIKLFQYDPELGDATILGLQEVDRNKKRSGNKNAAQILAQGLGMYYAWAAPPVGEGKEEETGVSILSVFPLSEVRRIVLPHKGPGGKRRVALGATVKIDRLSIRVYSVHGETRLREDFKIEQMKAVINDLASHGKDMPAIVLGDLNTWEPAVIDKTFKLFSGEGFQTPFARESTFSVRALFIPIKLKLDWIWLRNLQPTGHGIDRDIKLSDHWPLWVVLRRPDQKQ